MKPKNITPITVVCLAFGLLVFLSANTQTAQAQQVQVTAADPAAAAQGTINLNVKVTGKGFKNGAKAKWLVSGTTDPGGVVVNSTTFVNSGEVTANITVSDTAIVANFDIQVLNSDGRGGKGTELFAVNPKAEAYTCPPLIPSPSSDSKCYASIAGSPGCLDTTFGGIGFVTTAPHGQPIDGDSANEVLVQMDGKVIVAGTARIASQDYDLIVLRYNTDGSIDTSFGDPDPIVPGLRRGFVITPFTPDIDRGNAAILQPDGKIVVGGFAQPNMAVARYNSNGILDLTFGVGGKVTVNFGDYSEVQSIAIQSDGKLVLAGWQGQLPMFGLARLNQDGSLDSSFGTGGKLIVNPSGNNNWVGYGPPWSVAIQRVPAVTGQERIIVGGWSKKSEASPLEWTMLRLKPSGAKDTSFGTSGRVTTGFFGFGSQIRQIAIDSANRIVAAGTVRNGIESICGSYVIDYGIARYTQDGVLDASFSGGTQIVDVYGGLDDLRALVIQADGKIIIGGTAFSSDNSIKDVAIVRINSDGTRDFSFGPFGNGVVTTDIYGFEDRLSGVAVQPDDGKVLLTGSMYVNGNGDGVIGLARYWP
jgi:uncharacterized delta-60 repeat protein